MKHEKDRTKFTDQRADQRADQREDQREDQRDGVVRVAAASIASVSVGARSIGNGYAVAIMGEQVSGVGNGTQVLFQVGVFVGAALLFLVEPMVAKQLLPVFGGSASVWMTCLVFFQGALFAGYLYAHWMARYNSFRAHLALIGLAILTAAAWASGWSHGPGTGYPVTSILLRLALSVGAPFILLGATSPLLQVWQGRVRQSGVPYRLFGLSNAASLLALFAYPTLIEPYVSLRRQRLVWCLGVVGFAGISAVLAWRVRGLPRWAAAAESEPRAGTRQRVLWFALPLVAAMQLAAVTEHLTANVAAIPLLWMLPLAVYLLTFIVAFEPRIRVPRVPLFGVLAVLLVALGNFLTNPDQTVPIGLLVGLFLAELLVAGLACHGELYRRRPGRADEATNFYLMIAAGGAVGSLLVGVVAPLIFRGNYDLSLTFCLTGAALLAVGWEQGAKARVLWGALVLLLLSLSAQLHRAQERDKLVSVRNFYGSLRVKKGVTAAGDDERVLMHGSIQHGTQIFTPEKMRTPTTYYADDSGIGMVMWQGVDRPRRIGVVGLGVGTMAAYGRPGDQMRFYEINPAVRPIAQNLFTYLRQSGAKVSFAEGDAREVLAREPSDRFDVLVIDAFSGDAIPLHLLTFEAFALYRRHMAPGGVLAFHVSNQYVDLEPELAEMTAATGMEARTVDTDGNESRGEFRARWVLLAENGAIFHRPEFARARAVEQRAGVRVWTDEYSSLLPLMKW